MTFSRNLPTALKREICLQLETTEGSTFLNIGVTFASFQIKETLPLVREKLKTSLRGRDRREASVFRIRLLMSSLWSLSFAYLKRFQNRFNYIR